MKPTASLSSQSIAIEDIDHPAVYHYFDRLNAQDFQGTAHLFSESGELHPPLEEPVRGVGAIAQYLSTEAVGMQLFPQKGNRQQRETGETEINVQGYVKTSLFRVNVAWQFLINGDNQLQAVAIKLLASWEELAQIPR
ncbi:MAG: nuclear transport factor 2 [Cyanobacteria bacterium SW_9_44_58]|nr:MAG: nuclear transport factor 2 [Cyanobacteria bacterium SW_9_44_58]